MKKKQNQTENEIGSYNQVCFEEPTNCITGQPNVAIISYLFQNESYGEAGNIYLKTYTSIV